MKSGKDRIQYDQFLEESFNDGKVYRELRLSLAELKYLKEKYPNAQISKSLHPKSKDGKAWYNVRLQLVEEIIDVLVNDEENSHSTKEVAKLHN